MKRQFLKALWVVLMSFTSTLHAEDGNQRSALIIGLSEYGYPGPSPLQGVPRDMESATKMAVAMGIPKERIRFIRNRDATKRHILQALEQVADEQRDGRAFVYYSGHGTRSYDPITKNCVEGLLTYDGQTITNSEFASALKNLTQTSDKVIVMLDACFSRGVIQTTTRSIASSIVGLTPKFSMKTGGESAMCSTPVNTATRGLFNEVTRLGAIQENFVQIAAARENEASYDQAEAGGLATQGIRDCMLGAAKDLDRSGAVSLEEIQQCAQAKIDKVSRAANILPHHITVKGNRNLIPVKVQKPTEAPTVAVVAEPVKVPSVTAPVAVAVTPEKPPVLNVEIPAPAKIPSSVAGATPLPNQEITATSPVVNPVKVKPPQKPIQTAPTPPVPDAAAKPIESPRPTTAEPSPLPLPENKVLASLATLKDIESQRNPKRVVDVKLARSSLKIGKDALDLKIKSNHDGYLYMVLLGSDAKSFYVLFPNGLDSENRVQAGKTMTFPRPDWSIMANGPEGRDQLLVMVSDSPRKLDQLVMAAPSANEPFTYTLNDISGRSALIDFLVGSGVNGNSESFGAKLVSIQEVK